MSSKELWRWNVDDVWQSFSSMYQEMSFASAATNAIMRYHHLSACLLFGACAIESFLNKQMRSHQEDIGEDAKELFRRLRYTALREKLERWPAEMCGCSVPPPDLEGLSVFLDLRNEVTHRKRRDHSLYQELDEADPLHFVEALQRAFVVICEGLGVSFPYWLLGWNYVGMNGDETHPCLMNNQQFKHSLNNMGFRVPAWEYYSASEWEEKNMRGVAAFERLKSDYYRRAPDIEPKHPIFKEAPRLCKRWWDTELISAAA